MVLGHGVYVFEYVSVDFCLPAIVMSRLASPHPATKEIDSPARGSTG